MAVPVHPGSTEELAAAVTYAVTNRRRVALRAAGKGHGPDGELDGTLLVCTDRMRGVQIDPETRRARIGAGVLSRDLLPAAAAHGLTFLAGPSADVGLVGYVLGGGLGWLGRPFGLACNTVVGAQVVTADGTIRDVDSEQEPELFWALRGGGGSFAAVARLELRLVPNRQVHAGRLLWPIEQAADVLHCWRVWTAEVPDTVTSVARLLTSPSPAGVNADWRGRHYVVVDTVIVESEDDADIWLRPLRALNPALDTIAHRPCSQLVQLQDDTRAAARITDHQLIHGLTEDVVETLLERAGPGAASPPPAVDIRHLGGAIGRSAPGHGALDRIGAAYALHGLADHDLAGLGVDPPLLFDAVALRRLQAAKEAFDPEDRFVSRRPIDRPPGSIVVAQHVLN